MSFVIVPNLFNFLCYHTYLIRYLCPYYGQCSTEQLPGYLYNDAIYVLAQLASIIKGDNHLNYKEAGTYARKGHVILSLCGKTMGQILNEQEEEHINSIIVHFHPEQLKKLYDSTKSTFWAKIEPPVTQYIVRTVASNLVSSYYEGIKHLV